MCRHPSGLMSTAAIAFGPWLRCLLKPCKVGTRPNECDSQHVGLDQAQNSSNQYSARFVSTGSTDYRPQPGLVWLPSVLHAASRRRASVRRGLP